MPCLQADVHGVNSIFKTYRVIQLKGSSRDTPWQQIQASIQVRVQTVVLKVRRQGVPDRRPTRETDLPTVIHFSHSADTFYNLGTK